MSTTKAVMIEKTSPRKNQSQGLRLVFWAQSAQKNANSSSTNAMMPPGFLSSTTCRRWSSPSTVSVAELSWAASVWALSRASGTAAVWSANAKTTNAAAMSGKTGRMSILPWGGPLGLGL